jgi:uncharacterized protein (TIGR02453 family)
MPSAQFRGWTPEALAFYRGLEGDNSRQYWTEHKATFEREVRNPMLQLCAELEATYGTFHIFRPNRDVRFSRDKSPYKTAMGAVTEGQGGERYYVQVSADGLMAASGYYHMASDQLDRFREAVADNRAGPRLERAVAAVGKGGYDVGGEALKTAPRGYARDHPRVHLLRHKGMSVGRTFAPARWLATRGCLERITKTWSAGKEVNAWLNRHVGPSTELPPDVF